MSISKTNSEMLVAIKQSNKTARETRAQRLGFAGSKELIVYLELAIKHGDGNVVFTTPLKAPPISKGKSKPTTNSRTKSKPAPTSRTTSKSTSPKGGVIPTIHVVDVLDASGSMHGAKITAAIKGINIGIKSLQEDKAKVNYRYTLCDFSDDVIFRHVSTLIKDVSTIKGETRGSTALYDAIGQSIRKTNIMVKPGDKVLVNIYTDGQENSSKEFRAKEISELISTLSGEGWTFTFIGTEADVKYAQSNLKFHSSNTLVYDGTAKGLEMSFMSNNVARSAYSKKVEKGEDVSTGFYKDIK